MDFSWTILHSKLQGILQRQALLPVGTSILVAVSGGQDSLCLGQLLLDLRSRWHWNLAIGHCDHGWPGDRGIADHVRSIAAAWQLPFYCWSTQDLPETEAAARQWRYGALAQMAHTKNYTHIVTGHTQSDLAETLLYNLLRGAGSAGLSSLRAQRPLADRLLVRPLLHIDRPATGKFCADRQLPIWQDAYNDQSRYARNRIRRAIGAFQQDFHPQVTAHLAQTAEILGAEADYLAAVAFGHYQAALVGEGEIDRRRLQPLPLAIQRRVIYQFLQSQGITPSFLAIQAVVDLIDAPSNSRSSSLGGGQAVTVRHLLKIQ